MRRACLLVFGMVLLHGVMRTVAAEPTIQLRPDWKPGDSQRIESTTTREREFNGEIAPKRTIHETIDCQIVSADQSGLVVDWKLIDGRVEGGLRDPLAEALINLWRGQSVIVEMNRDGSARSVKNFDQLKHRLEYAVEAIVTQLRQQGGSKSDTAAIGRKLLDTFSTERVATAALTRDVVLYFSLLDKPLTEGTPLTFDAPLHNPLSADPIPSKNELTIAAVDPQTRIATITWTQIPDQETAAQILLGISQQLARRLDREVPLLSEQSQLVLQDTTTYEVDTSTAWVKSLKQTRDLRLQDYVQRDTREMRLVE
jgi:hypothetical protein